MFLKKLSCILLALWFLIGFYGCASISKKEMGAEKIALLEPQTIFKFPDLPIPIGFRPLPQSSYSFENQGVRVAILKYEGRANIDQVVNFYKEQMSLFNWNLLNVVEYGERLLNFEREDETCVITLVSRMGKVHLTIAMGPKPQALLRKAPESYRERRSVGGREREPQLIK